MVPFQENYDVVLLEVILPSKRIDMLFKKEHFQLSIQNVTKRISKLFKHTCNLVGGPEQISGRMRKEKIENTICCSTIYNVVKREHWQRMLARKGKKYKRRKGVEAGARLIPNRVDISQRPTIVDDKSEVGHWEGDTVYGQDGYLVTMVERVSKLLVTCKVRSKSKKSRYSWNKSHDEAL